MQRNFRNFPTLSLKPIGICESCLSFGVLTIRSVMLHVFGHICQMSKQIHVPIWYHVDPFQSDTVLKAILGQRSYDRTFCISNTVEVLYLYVLKKHSKCTNTTFKFIQKTIKDGSKFNIPFCLLDGNFYAIWETTYGVEGLSYKSKFSVKNAVLDHYVYCYI